MIRFVLILGLMMAAGTTTWAQGPLASKSGTPVCNLIDQKTQRQTPSEELAHVMAETMDEFSRKKVKMEVEDLVCLAKVTDKLDKYDADVRLRFSLLGYSEDYKTLWPQVLDKLTSKQKKNIKKILREAARLREEGNG